MGGESFNKYFHDFKYKEVINYENLRLFYDRIGLANKIVNIYPEFIWSNEIEIREEDKELDKDVLSDQFKQLFLRSKLKIINTLKHIDIMLGYSRYAVMFLGFKNESKLEDPVKGKKNINDLLFVRAYDEKSCSFGEGDIEWKAENPRYGLPKRYHLKIMNDQKTRGFEVHHSRIIHFSDGNIENELYGIPRLRHIYNDLENLVKISGAACESIYLNGLGALSVNSEMPFEDFAVSKQAFDEYVKSIIDNAVDFFKNKYKVFVSNQASVTPFHFPLINPKETYEMLIQIIAGAVGIPMRILLGTERGELASSQDAAFFIGNVKRRQRGFCERDMLRVVIDRFMELGIFVESTNYNVLWGDLVTQKDQERVAIIKQIIDTMDIIARNPSIGDIVNIEEICQKLGIECNEGNIDNIKDELDRQTADDADDDEEDDDQDSEEE